jgi:myosin-light-chain kinase
LKQEIQISLYVNHENIIKCYEVYEDLHYIHFVFEYIQGTDLFDYIIQSQNTCINEYQSAMIFAQILDAVHYLHLNNIVHRDIKLENFLIYKEDSYLKIKLIDFGFASKTTNGFLREKIGSLNYLAPEIFTDLTYNSKVDIWASGITLFNMLTGKQPFSNNSDSQLISDIVNKELDIEDKSSINC